MSSNAPLKLPPEFKGLTQEEAIKVAKTAKKLIQAHRKNSASKPQPKKD